jgi:hypothetical protein
MTVDIWIRDYNPPRCFQKKISGRGKHNGFIPFSLQASLGSRYATCNAVKLLLTENIFGSELVVQQNYYSSSCFLNLGND